MNFDYYAAEADRKLLIALAFSAVFHLLLLYNWPVYRHLFMKKIYTGDIEVTYLKVREQPAVKPPETAARGSKALPEISPPQKLVSEEPPKAAPVKKSDTEPPKKEPAAASPSRQPAAEQASRVVIKQPLTPKAEMPAPVGASVDLEGLRLIPPSYSQVVRDRIIDNLDTRKTGGEGDVYVRFVVTSSGALKEINIIDDRSTDDGVLRAAAFKAIKNAAPFPAFPEKVNLSEITFTCQIAFARK